MKPIIRAAVDSGRPPLELLLDHPDRKRSRWDGKLIKALYLNDAFDVDGHPIWVEESPDIIFQAKKKVLRSAAVIEKAQDQQGKKKNPEKGVRFYAEPMLKPGAKWPTRKAWEDRRSGKGPTVETGAENVERVNAAEERARAKVEADPELQEIVRKAKEKRKQSTGSMGE